MPRRKPLANLGSSVDFFSATSWDKRVGDAWYNEFWKYNRALHLTDKVELVDRKKFRQFDGVFCSGFYWGKSKDGLYFVQMSGSASEYCWVRIAPAASKVTRLDLAVTISFQEPYKGLAADHYEKAGKGVNRQRKYTIYQNSKGGQTLYVGSSKSEMMGRVYDRAKEADVEHGYTWRYEVQIRKPKCHHLALSLLQAWIDDKPVKREIVGYVWRWFKTRGISPQFQGNPTNLDDVCVELKAETARRKLHWLSTQVQPTVKRLVDVGLYDEVVKALGLDKPTVAPVSQQDMFAMLDTPLEIIEQKGT